MVEEGAVPDQPVPLSDHSRLVLPGQYLVLTRSAFHLMDAYQLELSGSLVEVEELPAMKSSGGTLYLTDRAGNVVEMVHYRAEMHMDLITDQHGISLERVSADNNIAFQSGAGAFTNNLLFYRTLTTGHFVCD